MTEDLGVGSTADKNLTVYGTSSAMGLSYKPWHVAGRYDWVSIVLLSNEGGYPVTITRPVAYPIGFYYTITWTQSHPDGANSVACCSGERGGWNDLINGVGSGIPAASSRTMTVAFRKLWRNWAANQSEGLADCPFSFLI